MDGQTLLYRCEDASKGWKTKEKKENDMKKQKEQGKKTKPIAIICSADKHAYV